MCVLPGGLPERLQVRVSKSCRFAVGFGRAAPRSLLQGHARTEGEPRGPVWGSAFPPSHARTSSSWGRRKLCPWVPAPSPGAWLPGAPAPLKRWPRPSCGARSLPDPPPQAGHHFSLGNSKTFVNATKPTEQPQQPAPRGRRTGTALETRLAGWGAGAAPRRGCGALWSLRRGPWLRLPECERRSPRSSVLAVTSVLVKTRGPLRGGGAEAAPQACGGRGLALEQEPSGHGRKQSLRPAEPCPVCSPCLRPSGALPSAEGGPLPGTGAHQVPSSRSWGDPGSLLVLLGMEQAAGGRRMWAAAPPGDRPLEGARWLCPGSHLAPFLRKATETLWVLSPSCDASRQGRRVGSSSGRSSRSSCHGWSGHFSLNLQVCLLGAPRALSSPLIRRTACWDPARCHCCHGEALLLPGLGPPVQRVWSVTQHLLCAQGCVGPCGEGLPSAGHLLWAQCPSPSQTGVPAPPASQTLLRDLETRVRVAEQQLGAGGWWPAPHQASGVWGEGPPLQAGGAKPSRHFLLLPRHPTSSLPLPPTPHPPVPPASPTPSLRASCRPLGLPTDPAPLPSALLGAAPLSWAVASPVSAPWVSCGL